MFRVVASNVVMRLRHGHIIDLLRTCKHSTLKAESATKEGQEADAEAEGQEAESKESERMSEFRKKMQETAPEDQEVFTDEGSIRQKIADDPLPPWPNATNPHTGEIGGPRGPEPTRYGDWERKGRVSDF